MDQGARKPLKLNVRFCAWGVGMFLGREGRCSQPVTLPYSYPSVSACRRPSGSRALSLPSQPNFPSPMETEGSENGLCLSMKVCVQHILGAQQGFPAKGMLLLKAVLLVLLAGARMLSLPALENTHHAWQRALFPQRLSGMRIGMIDVAHLCPTQDGCLRIGLCLWTREEVRVWGSLSWSKPWALWEKLCP